MQAATKTLACLTLLLMAFIFLMSAQDVTKSADLSDSITRLILNLLEPDKHAERDSEKISEPQDDYDVSKDNETVPSASFGGDYDPVPENEWFGIPPTRFKAVVRKTAHFILFMLLGILVNSTFISYFKKLTLKISLFSLVICVAYALCDEFHQLFVPGRGAQLSDVMIDSCGSVLGILSVGVIYTAVNAVRRKIRQ